MSAFFTTKSSRTIWTVMLFTAIRIFAFEHSIRKSSCFFLLLNGIFMCLTIFLMSSHSSDFIEWPATFTYKFLFFHICSLYYSDVSASLFLFTLNNYGTKSVGANHEFEYKNGTPWETRTLDPHIMVSKVRLELTPQRLCNVMSCIRRLWQSVLLCQLS